MPVPAPQDDDSWAMDDDMGLRVVVQIPGVLGCYMKFHTPPNRENLESLMPALERIPRLVVKAMENIESP